ncbi:DegT/DnrJ/EryC1/StrS family aminotransferase [Pontibacter anaerobius]|uniref:DegT/DnrJ/EryC1/StrS family aminotransferase n=1 Tax=Pontibacter anaerobius TaxID=2993940 RepID=A0ABT3RB60_9BACT|nr:DegT/DnrJ/EryC1/StrS family aminotransferase [Pontibacter anaerobius]MCX2739103.1 DegT/DnrJ/EryC1/StrS family aminotransferase [Pontibacter anaerobius]
MEDIKMTASKAIYAKLKSELDAAFSAVMGSMDFEGNAQVKQLAHTLINIQGVQHAMPCTNGREALQLALMALPLPEGAEVVIPVFNYAVAAEVVVQMGLKPVFADVDEQTFTLDPAAVERAITPATAAIIPVHMFGQSAPMDALLTIAEKYKLWLIEDSTQAFGAVYTRSDGIKRRAGAMGHMGVTSFFNAKPEAGTGEGAAVFTDNDDLAERLQHIVSDNSKYKVSQLDALQAAMLDVKVKYVDEYNASRLNIAQYYDHALGETGLIHPPKRSVHSSHTFVAYTIRVAPGVRDGLQQYLRDNHIPSMIYYPEPLHFQEAYQAVGYKQGDFAVAELLSRSVLSLPIHSELKEDQLSYICQHVVDYVKESS